MVATCTLGLEFPTNLDGLDNSIFNPRNTWENGEDYDKNAEMLTAKFNANFVQYQNEYPSLVSAGPII